jgi:hypothetical protein
MTIAVKTTAGDVKPANANAVIFRFIAGAGGTTAGNIVGMGTDGVVLCDGTGATNARPPIGIALQTVAATYPVDVVTHGPVACVTGAAEGSEVYPKDGTAGTPTHTASSNKVSVGFAQSASIIFVRPTYVSPA